MMDATTQRFAIRCSLSTRIVTIGALVVICVALAAVLDGAIRVPPDAMSVRVALGLVPVGLIVVLAVVALWAPLDYVVNPDSVVIRRLAGNVVIPRAAIRDVRRLTRGDVGFAWRWFGSGGFLGFFGYFSSAKLGRFRAYAADTNSLVLLTQTDGSKMLISPYLPERFIEVLRESPDPKVS